MLKLSVAAKEYIKIGDDIKIIFMGGYGNNLKIMVDAPREYNIVRSEVLERNNPEMEKSKDKYYKEPPTPEKFIKTKGEKAAEAEKRGMAKKKPDQLVDIERERLEDGQKQFARRQMSKSKA
jgi:carbon storage regulator